MELTRLSILLLAVTAASAQPVRNSLTFRQQIIGDLSQADWNDTYVTTATQSKTMSSGLTAPFAAAAGLHGADEGASVQLADGRTFFFLGDVVGVTWDVSTSKWLSAHWRTTCNFGAGQADTLCLGIHAMGLLPANPNHEACHALENLRTTVLGGSVQSSTCPTFTPITDASHTGQVPKIAFQNISNFQALDFFGSGHPPTGVFRVGTTLYALHEATAQDTVAMNLIPRTVILKADQPTGSITGTAAPTWTRKIEFTEAPLIPRMVVTAVNGSNVVTRTSGAATDTAWTNLAIWEGPMVHGARHVNGVRYTITAVVGDTITLNLPVSCTTCTGREFIILPNQNNSTGKFAQAGCELVTAAAMPAVVNSALPGPLQGQDVLFCFSASYVYRGSNLYLGIMKADTTTIDAATYSNGLSNMYYLTGVSGGTPTWTLQDEDSAVPLFNNWTHVGGSRGLPCIGENSVRFHPLLQRFVATYGSAECGGIWARSTDGVKPWLWSQEVQILVNHNQATGPTSWHAGLIHSPSNDNANFGLFPPTYDPDTPPPYTQFTTAPYSPYGLPGNAYGPYQLPADNDVDNGNNTVRVFTLISGFNPYVIWVAAFDVQNNVFTGLSGRTTLGGNASIR